MYLVQQSKLPVNTATTEQRILKVNLVRSTEVSKHQIPHVLCRCAYRLMDIGSTIALTGKNKGKYLKDLI